MAITSSLRHEIRYLLLFYQAVWYIQSKCLQHLLEDARFTRIILFPGLSESCQ
jgi:hypothetical protein